MSLKQSHLKSYFIPHLQCFEYFSSGKNITEFFFSTLPSGWVTFTSMAGELSLSEKKGFTLPKGLGEFLGADRFITMLEFIENPLQCQGNTLARVVSLCRHHVHRLERKTGWLTPNVWVWMLFEKWIIYINLWRRLLYLNSNKLVVDYNVPDMGVLATSSQQWMP